MEHCKQNPPAVATAPHGRPAGSQSPGPTAAPMTPPADPPPVDLGPYRPVAELRPGQTYRCDAPDGRPVVLKRVPDDCLHRGGLHPAIRDRLARLQQVPHPALAQLRAVDRLPAGTFAVWDPVDGRPWHPTAPPLPVVRAVEALHAHGLVHGAIHPGNVLLTPAGDVRLLHPSPYLYTDPAADLAGLAALFGLADVPVTLGELADALVAVDAARPVAAAPAPARWPWAVAAGCVAAAVVATGLTVHRSLDRRVAPLPFPPLTTRPSP